MDINNCLLDVTLHITCINCKKKTADSLNYTMIGKQFYNVPLKIRLSTTLAVLSVPRAFHLLGQ